MCPLSLEPSSYLPSHPAPLGCQRTPDLNSLNHTANFHWLSNSTYAHVYVSMLLSQFIPPSLYPVVYTSLFSIVPCRWIHQYHLSRLCIYVLICDICLSLSDLLRASLVTQTVENLPAMRVTWVQSLDQEDPLEKGMTTHSSILA